MVENIQPQFKYFEHVPFELIGFKLNETEAEADFELILSQILLTGT